MINIFFVPGMFGSTVEFCLRNFTQEFNSKTTNLNDALMPDGSMHGFKKEWHPLTLTDLVEQYGIKEITTPIYPMADAGFDLIFQTLEKLDPAVNIVICARDYNSAEMNLLFQYYKISTGVLNRGLEIFSNNNTQDLTHWNNNYTHWSDMQPWEYREWFSLFYPKWIQEWIMPVTEKCSALVVFSDAMLSQPVTELKRIVRYSKLTESNHSQLKDFIESWLGKQQYIINEFKEIDLYVNAAINNQQYTWTGPTMNIVTESIIQARLRAAGYEIKCDGLNQLPANAHTLSAMLYQVD